MADELVDAHRGAVSGAPSPALLLTDDSVILDVNEAYLRTVGLAREELVGRYVFDVFPGTDDDDSPLEASTRSALASGHPARLPLLKYDLPARSGTDPEERWWSVVDVRADAGACSARPAAAALEQRRPPAPSAARTGRHRDPAHHRP